MRSTSRLAPLLRAMACMPEGSCAHLGAHEFRSVLGAAVASVQLHHATRAGPQNCASFSTTVLARSLSDAAGAGDHNFGGAHGEVEEEDLQGALLDAALAHVPRLGWSAAAVQAAASDLGASPAAAGALERGPVQLVEHFNARCNAELEAALGGMGAELAGMRVHERVAAGAKLRLQMILPHIDSWPQALALQAQPAAVPRALRQYGDIADIIWRAAGDKSTDYNWYTKRGLLAGCYVSTELFMLTDCSPGYADTWAALERRLQDVMTVGRAAGQAGSAAGAAADAAGAVLQQLSAALGQLPRRP